MVSSVLGVAWECQRLGDKNVEIPVVNLLIIKRKRIGQYLEDDKYKIERFLWKLGKIISC